MGETLPHTRAVAIQMERARQQLKALRLSISTRRRLPQPTHRLLWNFYPFGKFVKKTGYASSRSFRISLLLRPTPNTNIRINPERERSVSDILRCRVMVFVNRPSAEQENREQGPPSPSSAIFERTERESMLELFEADPLVNVRGLKRYVKFRDLSR